MRKGVRQLKLRHVLSLLLILALSVGVLTDAEQAVYGESISAKAYIVMEAVCGQVTSQRNAQERLPMASTTKIMTAYLALCRSDIYEEFTVNSDAIQVEGTSMGLIDGDTVTLYDLACGMLLASGNDAANAAAVRIEGSIAGFAELMNETAARLGMNDTHFTNPSGLPDEEHYSTARDMAVLTATALEHPLFRQICRSVRMSVTVSGEKRNLKNHNRLLSECDGCIGVKTGFTKTAGRCLVSAVQRDGVTLICVTLSAPDDWNDHRKLYEHGFSTVQQTVLMPEKPKLFLPTVGGDADYIDGYVLGAGQVKVCLTEQENALVEQKWSIRPFYFAPVVPGQVLGQVQYYYKGKLLCTQLILAGSGSHYCVQSKNVKRQEKG